MTTFKSYWAKLTETERQRYAKRAGTTVAYIGIHLIHRRKFPRQKLMKQLAKASSGELSFQDMVAHFYGEDAAA